MSPTKARSVDEPLRSIIAVARDMEAHGQILHASLFPVQPWLDIPDLGFGVLTCTDGDTDAAQRAAESLADLVWDSRNDFDPDLVTLTDAIGIGLREQGTTAVADSGDAPSGGAAADNAGVLKALLNAGADRAKRLTYLTLCDAQAAQICAAAGIGSTVALDVGHKISQRDGTPLHIDCQVHTLSDGSFIMHDAGAEGTKAEFGLTAIVSIGAIRLAIRSLPSFEWDTGIYEAFGLRLREAALVFVKSPSHFKVAFGPRTQRILSADTEGPTCPNMRRLRFHNVPRPLFPLDPINDAAMWIGQR